MYTYELTLQTGAKLEIRCGSVFNDHGDLVFKDNYGSISAIYARGQWAWLKKQM